MKQELKTENKMRSFKIEKIILSCGATGTDLEKATKLLKILTGVKPKITRAGSRMRIPDFNVRPGLELGAIVTLRKEKALEKLRQLLGALDNTLTRKQVSNNHFSFGIREYIDIPGVEYQRDIGVRGLNITVVFTRPGIRVKRRKIKSGKFPERQQVSKEEIIKFMEEKFSTSFTGK